MTASTLDRDLLADRLHVFDERRSRRGSDVMESVKGDPVITQRIDGASTLEVVVSDGTRATLRDDNFGGPMYAVFAGLHFELASIAKNGDDLTLTFEDAIVAALRRRKRKLSVKAGTMTRRGFVAKLAKEANVAYSVDPEKRGPVRKPLGRSVHDLPDNSWDVLGEVAEEVHWRRFSDGTRLVVGSDEWLFDRDKNPTRLREFTHGVHNVDFTCDVRRRASEATVTVDVDLWALPPGSLVRGVDLGPADGKWLVSGYTRTATSPRGTVDLVRGRHALKEPKRARNASAGDHGVPDFPPGQAAPDGAAGAPAASGARAKMVAFALAQAGDAYVYGATGPDSWDCSGLVYAATAAAGNQIPARTSAGQWAAVQNAGKTMTVDQGIHTRGALLFIQTSDVHHVAISLGNGTTIEARGTAYGTGVFSVASSYTGAGWWV